MPAIWALTAPAPAPTAAPDAAPIAAPRPPPPAAPIPAPSAAPTRVLPTVDALAWSRSGAICESAYCRHSVWSALNASNGLLGPGITRHVGGLLAAAGVRHTGR